MVRVKAIVGLGPGFSLELGVALVKMEQSVLDIYG